MNVIQNSSKGVILINKRKTNLAIRNILKLIGSPRSQYVFIYTSKGKYKFAKLIYDNLNIHGFKGQLYVLDDVLIQEGINTFREQLIRISEDNGILFFIEPKYGKHYFDIFGRRMCSGDMSFWIRP